MVNNTVVMSAGEIGLEQLPEIKVIDHERYRVFEANDGERMIVYRNDLTKPTLRFIKHEFADGVHTYHYPVHYDKSALEPIQQIVFIANGEAIAIYAPAERKGILPGHSREHSIQSSYAPGRRMASIHNTDPIKEAKFLVPLKGSRRASVAFSVGLIAIGSLSR